MNLHFSKLKNKFYSNQLVNDSVWAIVGSLVLRGSGLVVGIFVANMLGAYDYGSYGALKNFVLSSSILSTLGLGYIATKFIAENKNDPSALNRIISICNQVSFTGALLIALLILFASDYVAERMFKDIELSNAVKLCAVWLFLNALTTVQQSYLYGFGRFLQLARINSVIGILTFVITVAFTKIYGLLGSLIALVVIQFINFVCNYWEIRKIKSEIKTLPPTGLRNISLLELSKQFLPVTVNELVFAFFAWLSTYLLLHLSSYAELGIYSAAMQWFMVIIYIPGVLRNVVLSALSSDSVNRDLVVRRMLFVNIISSTAISLIVILCTSFFIKAYGEEFNTMKPVLIILSLTAIINSVANVYVQALLSSSYIWIVAIFRLVYDGLTSLLFVGLYSLHFWKGAFTMSLSLMIATFFYTVLCYIFYRKYSR